MVITQVKSGGIGLRYYQSKPDWDETGRLRHIGLARGEVAPAVLMPGDPGRCEAMQRLFAAPHFVGQRGAFATYTGETSGGAPISVMSSGMGCMNVSLALEELSHLGVDTVIRVGTGGAVQLPFSPGTLVIATGCVRGEGASQEYLPPEFPAVADYRVVSALRRACRELEEEPVVGLYRSHDCFYMESPGAHPGLFERIQIWRDTNVQLLENESGTLFSLGHLLGIKTGSICIAMGSLFDEHQEEALAAAAQKDPQWLQRRVEVATRASMRAVELLREGEGE